MNRIRCGRRGLITAAATLVAVSCGLYVESLQQPALATRLSPELTKAAQSEFDGSKVRLDGSLQRANGELYLPLLPAVGAAVQNKKNQKVAIESKYPPNAEPADLVFFSNGWAFVRLLHKGDACTAALSKDMPDKLRKRVESLRFPLDLIVPQGFVMPRSFKALITDVPTISLLDDATVYSPDFGKKKAEVSKHDYKGDGTIFLTSISAGSITMLDGKTLNKIAEFPTEGTPCSMEFANGLIYVADEAKNRILIVDPVARKFKGQIDLPGHCAPHGIAAPASGKWLYVSESAAGLVESVETASGKTLVKTKTRPEPGRMALTPDGTFLLVLNVSSGELTVMSTYNQQVVSTIRVGDMPTSIVISADGKLAYVSNRSSNTVAVVDIEHHKVINNIKTGQGPTGIALSPDNTKLYVASGRENTISIFDTKAFTKVNEVHAPSDLEFPGSLCLLPGGHTMLVCSPQTDVIGVFDTDKMEFERTVAIGHSNNEADWEPVP